MKCNGNHEFCRICGLLANFRLLVGFSTPREVSFSIPADSNEKTVTDLSTSLEFIPQKMKFLFENGRQ